MYFKFVMLHLLLADAEEEEDEVIKDSHLVSLVHDKLHKDSQTLDTGMVSPSMYRKTCVKPL